MICKFSKKKIQSLITSSIITLFSFFKFHHSPSFSSLSCLRYLFHASSPSTMTSLVEKTKFDILIDQLYTSWHRTSFSYTAAGVDADVYSYWNEFIDSSTADDGLDFPGRTRTKDKYRVVYTDNQRLELEKEFHFNRYITIRRKAEIAANLGLSERQVSILFMHKYCTVHLLMLLVARWRKLFSHCS